MVTFEECAEMLDEIADSMPFELYRDLNGGISLLPQQKIHGIMGVFSDKDYETMVEILCPYFSDIVAITPPSPRGLAKEQLADVWKKKSREMSEQSGGIPLNGIETADNPMEALKKSIEFYEEGDAIVIFGSLSFFKELKWK